MIKIEETDTPWEAACKIINATCPQTHTEIHNFTLVTKVKDDPVFDLSDLYCLGTHLIGYAIAEGYKPNEDE